MLGKHKANKRKSPSEKHSMKILITNINNSNNPVPVWNLQVLVVVRPTKLSSSRRTNSKKKSWEEQGRIPRKFICIPHTKVKVFRDKKRDCIFQKLLKIYRKPSLEEKNRCYETEIITICMSYSQSRGFHQFH